mmetsp:Transcript_20499/g.30438  ORF Transcript_20499/g.30438 Transcript_20499/m.30438 type:complete len:81 (+) Transcript_20499:496-738(+)
MHNFSRLLVHEYVLTVAIPNAKNVAHDTAHCAEPCVCHLCSVPLLQVMPKLLHEEESENGRDIVANLVKHFPFLAGLGFV